MRLTIVEVADGQLGLYCNDEFVVESDDGLLIEVAEKLRDLNQLEAYHYVHRPNYELDEFPEYLIEVFMQDVED